MKAIAVLLLCLSSSQAAFADHSKPTQRDVAAIVKAVEDEIYDWGYEKDFTNIGTTGAISSPTDVSIFISPELDEDGSGGVIYRFMPFGEVLRQFTLLPDGMVVLEGNPWNGFPATQPDTKTIYVDDDFICAYKQKAIRASFTVDPNISRARREEAARRQIMRLGSSQFLGSPPQEKLSKRGPARTARGHLNLFTCSHMALGNHSKPTERDIAAIVQAVEDEIYDWGYERDFTNIGTTGAISSPTDIPIFISPELEDDGSGSVIYRLMPFGEVLRRFAFRPDGIVVLWGNPWNGFPATQPDTKTIYLHDDDVCEFKQEAIRAYFTVDPQVSRARREEAARRQIIRVGHSQFLEGRSKENTRTGNARP